MMKRLLSFVTSVVLIYIGFLVTKEEVVIKFTLSEKVPTKFTGLNPSETVQHLVVKNVGDIAATNIQIRISQELDEFLIQKSSNKHLVTEHNSNSYFESEYPVLTPSSQFSYIFRTKGEGLNYSDLEIKHSKGKAIEALSNESENLRNKAFFLYFGFILMYLALMLFSLRKSFIDSFISKGKYSPIDEYLNLPKPFYLGEHKWKEIRLEYIKTKDRPTRLIRDLEESEAYKILVNKKPDYLNDSEWIKLLEVLKSAFNHEMSYYIDSTSTYAIEKLEYILKIDKPLNVTESQWAEQKEKMVKKYFSVKMSYQSIDYANTNKLEKYLEEDLSFIQDCPEKSTYFEIIKNLYYLANIENYRFELDPMESISKLNEKYFNEKQWKFLNSFAYRLQLLMYVQDFSIHLENEKTLSKGKPDWLSEKDYKVFKRLLEEAIYVSKSIREAFDIKSCLSSILTNQDIDSEDLDLNQKDISDLLKLQSDLSAKSIKNIEEREKLIKEKEEVSIIKEKIIEQLDVIDELLKKPASIKRIEDYQNPFSEGNYKNLLALSDLMLNKELDSKAETDQV